MSEVSPTPRPSRSNYQPNLSHSLKQYATAAFGVAAAGSLAMAQVPSTHIVYTPANIPLTSIPKTVVPIDFNHDGVADLTISATGFSQAFSGHGGEVIGSVFEQPAAGNLAIGGHAIPQGVPLSQAGAFRTSRRKMVYARWRQLISSSPSQTFKTSGPFQNVTNKYLGVKFQINGQMHYGWIRLSLAVSFGSITGSITGYAFNTIANQSIAAGQIRPADANKASVDEVPVGSLGMLAAGSAAIPYWRH